MHMHMHMHIHMCNMCMHMRMCMRICMCMCMCMCMHVCIHVLTTLPHAPHAPQICSAAPLLLTYDARTRTISSWSSHSGGEPVQIPISTWSSRELGGCREGDGPMVYGAVPGEGRDVPGGGNGCVVGGAGVAGDAVGDAGDAGGLGDAEEEELGARPLLSAYGSQAVLALGGKLMWLGAPHLPQAQLRLGL